MKQQVSSLSKIYNQLQKNSYQRYDISMKDMR